MITWIHLTVTHKLLITKPLKPAIDCLWNYYPTIETELVLDNAYIHAGYLVVLSVVRSCNSNEERDTFVSPAL